MPEANASVPDENLDTAFNRVLEVEREAREAVEAARHDAEAMVNDARLVAQRIRQRANERIDALRTRLEASTRQKLAAIEAESDAIARQPVKVEASDLRLNAAVRSLAAELTGGLDDGHRGR